MGTAIRNRSIVFTLVFLLSVAFVAPTLLQDQMKNISWISRPLSLGLDLRGGVHLVYEVLAGEAVKSRMQSYANSLRSELRTAKVPVVRAVANSQNQVELTLLSSRGEEKAKSTIADSIKELSFVERRAEEGERVVLVYGISPVQSSQIEEDAVGQAVETIRSRIDQFGVAEPLIQRQGERRILVQMPGETDIVKVKNLIGRVAKLEFRLVPVGESAANTATVKDRSGATVKVEDAAVMAGDAVRDANIGIAQGKIAVQLRFTSQGAAEFGRITTENVGRQLSIILDGVEYSRPVIREPIRDGNCEISGGFTHEEAQGLRNVLRSGALPAPLSDPPLEERTVGPSLGHESIQKGLISIAVGFVAIALFMVFYYGKSGALAVVSLILNTILIFGALSAFGATLTLPGLAGVALTIGMAVDSNVLIFERIRDEIRIGASRDAAVKAGFDKAFSAIIDSNLTTLVSALILVYFGTGSIKGFGLTLAIGVLTTLYAATFASRLGFDVLRLTKSDGQLSV